MPATTTLDLTGLWHRELTLRGCYAYTPDDFAGRHRAGAGQGPRPARERQTYPLDRYRDAIDHAANAGARGAVKIAFDLRNEKERTR